MFYNAQRRMALILVNDVSFKVFYKNSGGDLCIWKGLYIILLFTIPRISFFISDVVLTNYGGHRTMFIFLLIYINFNV